MSDECTCDAYSAAECGCGNYREPSEAGKRLLAYALLGRMTAPAHRHDRETAAEEAEK